MNPVRIAVAGGGISGLVAGHTLQQEASRRGLPIELSVLESSVQAGGHASSVTGDGWVVERGPNGFLDRGEETMALIDELQLRSSLVEADPASRRRFILQGGRLCRVPESPPALITTDALGWRGKWRLIREPWAAAPPADTDETVFEFAERRLGREAAETFVDTAVAGISAGDSRKLSVRSQFPVLKEWETAHGSLLKAVLARRKTGGGRARLMSLQRGMGAITTALSERLNGALRVQSPVVRIEKCGAGWRLATSTGSSLEVDRVVCALPSHVASAATAGVDSELAAALASIPYASISVVALGYPRSAIARPLDGYGYLVTRQEGHSTLGVLWESSIFPGRAPADHVLLRIMLGGARHPQVRELDDKSVAGLAMSEASAVLGISGDPVRQWVFRWPSAIAQYTVGHDGRTAAIRRALGAHRGLHVCGTAYDGVSFNDAVASARRTARQVIEELAA